VAHNKNRKNRKSKKRIPKSLWNAFYHS